MSHIYTVVQFNEASELWAEQASTQARNMAKISQYWNPEFIEQYQQSTPTPIIAGQLLRFNTPQSRFEKVHLLNGGSLSVVANARLDNREALFQLLQQVPDSKIADGLLIGLLYQRLGIELLQHLLGDFAFIIWDEAQQQLIAACDHFGVKNLFYGDCDLGLMVTNEHKALLTASGVDNRINPDYLVKQWLTAADTGYISPCIGIKSIPPAHYLLASRDGVSCHRYWQLASREYPEFSSREQSIAGLRQRFEVAVRRRLITDFTLGAELSEGLDSPAICAVAAKNIAPKPVLSFSYECEPPNSHNAQTYADILDFVAMYDNIRPQWRETAPVQSEAKLTRLISADFGAPMPSSGQWLERYPLIRNAGVRTLLSGWGGDHCVTGYAEFFEDELLQNSDLISLLSVLKRKHLRGRGAHPLKAFARLVLKYKTPGVYRRLVLNKNPFVKHYNRLPEIQPVHKRWLSEADLAATMEFSQQFDLLSVKQRDWRELFTIGVHWRLIGSEVVGRYFQIDYRFPMLDKELVEYVYSMPSAFKVWRGVERAMFRDAITGLVTEKIRTRFKSDVVLPAGQLQNQIRRKRQYLTELTSTLQNHPVTACFFNNDIFAAIPINFADKPTAATKLLSLQELCQLYDQGLLRLPTPEQMHE